MTRAALALVVIAVVVVLVVERSPDPPAARSESGPTQASAVRAAVDALYALTVPAITSRTQFEAAASRLAAPGAERRVETSFGATEPAVAAAFRNEPRVLRSAPLGYRIDQYSAEEASVAIWTVAIAASDSFGSESQWRTLTLDLVWTPNGWKVSDGRGAAGPDPATPLRQLALEAATFRSFTHGP